MKRLDFLTRMSFIGAALSLGVKLEWQPELRPLGTFAGKAHYPAQGFYLSDRLDDVVMVGRLYDEAGEVILERGYPHASTGCVFELPVQLKEGENYSFVLEEVVPD